MLRCAGVCWNMLVYVDVCVGVCVSVCALVRPDMCVGLCQCVINVFCTVLMGVDVC